MDAENLKGNEKRLKNLKPFKEGDPPGPGRRPLTEVEREAKEILRREISELWPKYNGMSLAELKALDIKHLPASEAIMVKSLIKAIPKGDTSEIHRMYNRIVGQPKVSVGHNIEVDISKKISINVNFAEPETPSE